MNTPDSNLQEPTTPCPDWCEMHVEGRHVGHLDLARTEQGFNIYTRPTDWGDGEVGLEVVVADTNGPGVTRVAINPGEVVEASMLADLRSSINDIENGEPVDGETEAQ